MYRIIMYRLRKAPKKELYWVVKISDGKHMSLEPIPKERAEAQMRALYASESKSIPSQYTEGLTKAQTKKQKSLIQESKSLYEKSKIVEDRPKVSETKTKRSPYVIRFENKYGFPITEISKVKAMFNDSDIDKILSKGAGAYASSGSRPNVSIAQWSYARLASVLTGGPALKIDKDLVGPMSMKKIKQ